MIENLQAAQRFRGIAMALALVVAAAVPAIAQDPSADTVVARVNGDEITLGHMIAMRARLPEQIRQMPDDELFQGILDQLVEQKALADSLGDTMDRRTRVQLENAGNEIRANALLTAAAEAAVTDEALQALYAERFLTETAMLEYNAAHILVASQDEAQGLIDALQDGGDFAELAQMHSLDTGSAAAGGDLGWFGEGRMVAPFEAAVVALDTGALSEPVETRFGWHVIRLNDTRQAEAPEFEAVRADLARSLQQEAVLARIASAREGAEVELTAEGIDPALLRDQTLLAQ